jgi:hypothetical protein
MASKKEESLPLNLSKPVLKFLYIHQVFERTVCSIWLRALSRTPQSKIIACLNLQNTVISIMMLENGHKLLAFHPQAVLKGKAQTDHPMYKPWEVNGNKKLRPHME